jgi:hypothetical protein
MYASGMRLIYERVAHKETWRRSVLRALNIEPTMAHAAVRLGVSRETLRKWCRELGIAHGDPGRRPSKKK